MLLLEETHKDLAAPCANKLTCSGERVAYLLLLEEVRVSSRKLTPMHGHGHRDELLQRLGLALCCFSAPVLEGTHTAVTSRNSTSSGNTLFITDPRSHTASWRIFPNTKAMFSLVLSLAYV